MKKTTKIILAAVVLALVAVGMFFAYQQFKPKPEEGSKSIEVVVVHKDGSEKVFPVKTDAEYLAQVLVDEGIVEDNQTEYGLYILVADGEYADYNADGGWWAVYDGDTQATVGASELPIKDGGTYKVVYTIGWG